MLRLPRHDPLAGHGRRAYVQLLQQKLRGRVRQAYLFGSVAEHTHGPGSDVDLILVAESRRPFVERFRDFEDIISTVSAMDLLVYTPQEFERIRATKPVGFWKSVFESAVQII